VVDTDRESVPIDERIYGQFLEHINHSVEDGLFAEQIGGAGFEGPDFETYWEPFSKHGYVEIAELDFPCFENSLDAMKDRGVLTLAVKWQGNTFLIEIADDGGGILEECMDRFSNPSLQPSRGLDTVQRVVARHFGAVALHTSTSGTVFHVRLPVTRVEIY
jgi:hypothetical protein